MSDSSRPSLLERESELAAAEAAFRAARAGQGSVLLVEGRPGTGKTALLRAFAELAEAGPMTVLRACGARNERDFSWGVLAQLLNPLLFRTAAPVRERWLSGSASPIVAEPAGGLVRRDLPDGQQQAGFDAVLAEVAADGPVLVLVDDLHQADQPSLRWLARWAHRVRHQPVVLACVVCEGDVLTDEPLVRRLAEAAAATLRPQRLTAASVRALLTQRTGMPVDEQFAQSCWENTSGLPMFVAAVADELAAAGDPPGPGGPIRPVRLRDWLLTCLQAQPEPVWQVAKAVTVLDRYSGLAAISRLTGFEEAACEPALRTLSRLGLLEADRPRFSWPLISEMIDESMTFDERERAHVRAAEDLHRGGCPVEEVAQRLLGVLPVRTSWAVETLREAADTAIRRRAPEAAARYLRRLLLDGTLEDDDRAAAHVALATAELGADRAAAVRHVAQATTLLRGPEDRAAALTRLSPTLFADAPPYVRDLLEQVAAELGPSGAPGSRAHELVVHLEARARHIGSSDPAELQAAAGRLRDLGPNPAVSSPAERELLTVLLFAASKCSGLSAAEVAVLGTRVLRREPAAPAQIHGVLPLLIDVLCAAGAIDELVPWLDSALAQCEDAAERTLIEAERALVSLNQGNLAKAGEIAHRVMAGPPPDWARTGTTILAPLGLTAVINRDAELIRRLLADPPEDDRSVLVSALLGLLRGMSAALGGDRVSGLAFIRDIGWQLEQAGWRNPGLFSWRLSAAALHRQLGETEQARELAELEYERARGWGAAVAIGRAARVLGDLTPGGPGLDLLRESAEMLEKSANRSELARTLVRLGARLREIEPDEAAVLLARAEEIAVECGDPVAADRARRSGAEALTRAEQRVVELAVEGRTNQEIARVLEVSVRAVEKHLTKSFRKLRVRRRTELASVLRAQAAQV
ncbi:AAA family ATPase [Amycolatopsis sp. PS_44_ISF1]|uniref:AAA family ATPase n=1 Tax=Amycolatopsis sp. PS_44_ISF1 TaxID=2974917 RepID=UPI0028E89592|nr:AAA family ATPase [Amycolatopsis sp. PS_44_ISF1]